MSVYCKNCGKVIADDAKFCQYCGASQEQQPAPVRSSTRIGVVYCILAVVFGTLGLHRFYVRDVKGGLLYLLFGFMLSFVTLGISAIIAEVLAIIDGIIHVRDEVLIEKFGHLWK